jgi:hypothetical protein
MLPKSVEHGARTAFYSVHTEDFRGISAKITWHTVENAVGFSILGSIPVNELYFLLDAGFQAGRAHLTA